MRYDLEKIGKTIRQERKKLKRTQDKFGKMLGVSGKQISNYENGKLLPPQDILLHMADLFNCEYGYLLGEESYKDGSKLTTAVCESLGLSSRSVESLRAATHKGLTRELDARQQAINSFFESHYFQGFIDCLVEAINISKDLKSRSNDAYEELRIRYGEELVNRASIYCALSDAIPDSEAKEPKFREVTSEIESVIDASRNQEYALKVARYELREAFEALIRNIQ